MRKLVYHIATTLDGYIAKADGSIPGFLQEGEHVSDYFEQLKAYDTVLMGRQTYAMSFPAGLVAGQPSYPRMRNIVFSRSLELAPELPDTNPVLSMWQSLLGYEASSENAGSFELVRENSEDFVRQLKAEAGTAIYLCGGASLATELLKAGLIDELVLKVNPVLYGEGIKLFEDMPEPIVSELVDSKVYSNGVLLLTYLLKS